eukprot:8757641-Pyramimonas_sp.AAC.1
MRHARALSRDRCWGSLGTLLGLLGLSWGAVGVLVGPSWAPSGAPRWMQQEGAWALRELSS